MKRLLSIVFVVLLLFGCTEDQNPNPHTEDLLCGDTLYFCNNIFGYSYSVNNTIPSYYSPVFNPNDPNEIMYLKRYFDNGSWRYSLERYNYSNGSHQVVISPGDMASNNLNFWKYQWGKNDWIVLENDYNSQIYKLRSDGTQLSQFTNNGNSFFPFLSITGDTVFFSNYGSSEYGIMANIQTNTFLDSIPGSYGMGTFLNDGHIVCTLFDEDTVRILDANNLTIVSKFHVDNGSPNFSGYNFLYRVHNDVNSVIALSPLLSIDQININTHSTQIVRQACGSDMIKFQTVSSDGNKIAFTVVRNSNTSTSPCLVITKQEIHIMNIDGSNEQLIDFPH